jgi:hypothetical protein
LEEYFQPNTAICCANQEEFTELCKALTDAGFYMYGRGNEPEPENYKSHGNNGDPEVAQDAIYIMRNGRELQYTSKYYSEHGDDDHPTVVDFCDIFAQRIEVGSIDELI